MSDTNTHCPNCDQPLLYDEAAAGATVDCPTCGKPLQLPGGTAGGKVPPPLSGPGKEPPPLPQFKGGSSGPPAGAGPDEEAGSAKQLEVTPSSWAWVGFAGLGCLFVGFSLLAGLALLLSGSGFDEWVSVFGLFTAHAGMLYLMCFLGLMTGFGLLYRSRFVKRTDNQIKALLEEGLTFGQTLEALFSQVKTGGTGGDLGALLARNILAGESYKNSIHWLCTERRKSLADSVRLYRMALTMLNFLVAQILAARPAFASDPAARASTVRCLALTSWHGWDIPLHDTANNKYLCSCDGYLIETLADFDAVMEIVGTKKKVSCCVLTYGASTMGGVPMAIAGGMLDKDYRVYTLTLPVEGLREKLVETVEMPASSSATRGGL